VGGADGADREFFPAVVTSHGEPSAYVRRAPVSTHTGRLRVLHREQQR
jgi:hypothetical protein